MFSAATFAQLRRHKVKQRYKTQRLRKKAVMKTPNHQQFGEPNLTITPAQYVCAEPDDRGPLAIKPSYKRTNKQRVRALTELIVQLPEGGTREIVSEAFTAIINGEGDIKHLRALTMSAARQLRTMYLSGGERASLADMRWKIRDFVWTSFGLQLSIGPRGLHLGEGKGPDELNAFLRIESNGQIWAGETYEDAPVQSNTYPLTTEEVFQRLSEKLLTFLY